MLNQKVAISLSSFATSIFVDRNKTFLKPLNVSCIEINRSTNYINVQVLVISWLLPIISGIVTLWILFDIR